MIRTSLTLWNSIVFGTVLTLVGFVIYLTTYAGIYRAVDEDLARRSVPMEKGWMLRPAGDRGPGFGPGPGGPRPGDARGPGPDGQGPDDHRGGPGDDGGRPPGPPGPPDQALNAMLSTIAKYDPIEADRIRFSFLVSRPRIFRHDHDTHGPPREQPFDGQSLASGFAGQTTYSTVDVDGHRLRILSVPLRNPNKDVDGVGQYAASLDSVDLVASRLRTMLLALLPLALVGTSLLGVWLTNRALRPVKEIAAAAERIEATNLTERLPVRGHDEFAFLSSRFNRMIERIEGSYTRLTAAYEAQRRFIADASHELKTPLTTVKGRVSLALSGNPTQERYAEHMRSIGRAADNMNAIIQDLLFLAAADENKLNLRLETCSVRKIACEAAGSVAHEGVAPVEVEVPDDLEITADPALMTRSLTNLMSNAVRHSPPDRPMKVTAHQTAGALTIEISDQGEGIAPEHLPMIFDRFYRVDSARDKTSGGTGLGLAIVKSILEAHGFAVEVESELGAGTTVRLTKPIA